MAGSLEYYRRQRNNINNQIIARRRKNDQIKADIETLQRAYDKLKRIKDDEATPIRSDIKKEKYMDNLHWRGKNKDEFDKMLKNEAKNNAKDFVKSIDDMLDAVGWAIHQKRSELNTGNTALNKLQRSYSWLSTQIRNLLN